MGMGMGMGTANSPVLEYGYGSTLALSARKSAEYEKKFQVAKIFSRPFALFAKKS